jgi:hypothetical protein
MFDRVWNDSGMQEYAMDPGLRRDDSFRAHHVYNRHHLHVMTAALADRMRPEFPTRSQLALGCMTSPR